MVKKIVTEINRIHKKVKAINHLNKIPKVAKKERSKVLEIELIVIINQRIKRKRLNLSKTFNFIQTRLKSLKKMKALQVLT